MTNSTSAPANVRPAARPTTKLGLSVMSPGTVAVGLADVGAIDAGAIVGMPPVGTGDGATDGSGLNTITAPAFTTGRNRSCMSSVTFSMFVMM